ncbi:MAG: 5-(carboxyamino)imidazole ribonucleotide synthase [Crocinitomicaceae bacterium]|nr:5-(carboxyamino)imidazole ribonucleotide synthase [Crocinitomicaceae bacterium]
MVNEKSNLFDTQSVRLGLLGGGQLGRMMIQEAISYNIEVHVLDGDPKAPCSTIATTFTTGSITDYDTVLAFGKDKDVITVEIENVNIEALEELERLGKKIYPQPRVLKIIKDKGLQKQFYQDNQLPTAPFIMVNGIKDIENNVNFIPAANKLRTGGYDGKGVTLIKSKADIKNGFDAPGVLESFVPFTKELAVIVARNASGETVAYPTVECEFSPVLNLVEFLFAPADISEEIESKAKKLAIDVINKLDMIGILAIEFFLLENGDLLINEIAPRPHNSGHHTIECNNTSQFEQHFRAVLNLPLGNTDIITPGVMINLLGEEDYNGPAKYIGVKEAMSKKGVFIHLYGKTTTKPHRKMGHLTVTSNNLSEAKQLARGFIKTVKVIA